MRLTWIFVSKKTRPFRVLNPSLVRLLEEIRYSIYFTNVI